MPRRVLSALLFTALSSASVWAQNSSGGAVPETMSGYHPSATWSKNTGDTFQHPQPSMKSGGSSATYASRDEIQLIQQKIASRRAQQAHYKTQALQPAVPEAAPQKP